MASENPKIDPVMQAKNISTALVSASNGKRRQMSRAIITNNEMRPIANEMSRIFFFIAVSFFIFTAKIGLIFLISNF